MGGGAGFVLLFLLLTASSAFAQRKFYIDPVNGRADGRCDKIDPANANGPCTPEHAFKLTNNADGDLLLIRVRRAGGSVTLAAPTVALDKRLQFGTYVQGSTTPVKGMVQFTGAFTIAAAGEFRLDPNASVQFEDVTLSAGDRTFPFFYIADKSEERITVTGTLTIPDGERVRLPALVVSKGFTVKGGTNAEKKTSEFRVGGPPSTGGVPVEIPLTVRRGATLRIDGVDLVVHLGKEILVEGVIEDMTKGAKHPLRVALLNSMNSATAPGNRQAASLVGKGSYEPLLQGFDHNDCLRIRGTGMIPAGIFAISMGNLCVELKRVGRITASGSLANDIFDNTDVTTDLIFREDVVVDGDVVQWNDSRILFAKTATIRGDVILRDGGTPYTNTDDYGEANTAADSGVRTGWEDALNNNQYTCEYSNRLRRLSATKDGGVWTVHIPGVHFAGAATIAGDLNVYSNTLTETTTGATADATKCAPRVLFMAPLAEKDATRDIRLLSSVGGSLVVDDTVSFGGKGRIYLDSDSLRTFDTSTSQYVFSRKTAHSLRVGGDLSAGGKTIGMAYPSTSSIDGMCTGKDISLTFGNHLVLTDAAESVVVGDATSGLTLDALVTLGDLRVEPGKGPLTVTTLHVGSGAELMANKDVKVTESVILQGELSGELDEASTIKTLTYGNRNTDLVKKAALVPMLDALSIHIGRGELRLDEMVQTKTLGLCSGTLSLMDTESTTDSTLHVTEQITVQNGMLAKDTNDPGSISTDKATTASTDDRYILKYVTPGPHTVTDALEWFDPRDVIVDHAKAEITVTGDRSLMGKLTVSRGKLMVDGELTVGTSALHRDSATNVDSYSAVVTAGELHTKGQAVVVHGKVIVSGKSKLVTGGGDLHVLGRVSKGKYTGNTAQVTIEKEAVMDLGAGTLMLGPEDTAKRDNLENDRATPQVDLVLTGKLLADTLRVPGGSKRTHIVSKMSSEAHENSLPTVLFNGKKTPNDKLTNNRSGRLFFDWVGESGTDDGTTTIIDSLAVLHGGFVEFHGKKAEITKDFHLSSGRIWVVTGALDFKGDMKIDGSGRLEMQWDNVKRRMFIGGNFTQTNNTGVKDRSRIPGTTTLGKLMTKTVMGDLVVGADTRYAAYSGSNLFVYGNVQYNRERSLRGTLELTGDTLLQTVTVSSHPESALGNIVVNNPNGILLGSHVKQSMDATLMLRRGKIHSMPVDSMFTWTVQNVQGEQELRGRLSAQEGAKCGADTDEACKATILRGSRQSYVATPVVRDLLQGTAGAGFASGGYLFPVGMEEGDMSRYRPLILQLPSDLNDTTAVTVSPIMVPEGAMPAWQNLTVPAAGGNLTLDVYAPIFWKIDLGEELPTNTNLRVAADGIQNVTDVTGLRLVQWDCSWKNPKLAGQLPAQTEESSFAVNGYIGGVLNLTQEGIGLESCAILGIAADGSENPIDQADLSGGRAMVQFIHNVPAPGSAPMEIDLGEVRISNNLRFRTATAYRPVGAGTQNVTIQPVGAPAAQAITSTLTLEHDRNYAVIAHGSLADPKLKVLDMRMTSSVATKAEVRLVHGAPDLGPAQVQVMNPTDPMMPVMTLAGNLMLDEATRRYIALDPLVQVMQVKSTDGEVQEFYELDLYGYGGQTLVLNLSGTKRDLTILGVDRNGKIVPVQIVTGAENEMVELPTEFALHGNYPNPFNPSTRIQFDLPERAQVHVQIVDLLGREVMVVPGQEMEAGANRSIELHAINLASGTYLYRLIAAGAEKRHVKTGRMMLLK